MKLGLLSAYEWQRRKKANESDLFLRFFNENAINFAMKKQNGKCNFAPKKTLIFASEKNQY
jgi:hypothetical protein